MVLAGVLKQLDEELPLVPRCFWTAPPNPWTSGSPALAHSYPQDCNWSQDAPFLVPNSALTPLGWGIAVNFGKRQTEKEQG